MELTVNSRKKKSVHKNIVKSKKSVYVIATVSKILLIVGLIGGTLYLLVNFLSPSLSMVKVNGVLKKDTSFILITSSFIFSPCLIFSACLNALSKNLGGSSSFACIDESILLADNQLRYSFRIKHQSTSSERQVFTIDFSDIKTVDYNNQTGAVIFGGRVLGEYYDDYKKNNPVVTDYVDGFIIYDYFTPSLRDSLIDMGIHINN